MQIRAPDKKTNIVNVDRLSKEVLNFIMDISSIKNNFITGLQETVSADKIEYNTKFIKDNDTVIMRGYCQKGSIRVGFGEVKTKLLKSL